MNRICKVLIAALFIFALGLDGRALAEVGQQNWSHVAEIQAEGTSKYKAIFLDGTVYEQALPDLGDLRIIDGQGQFVPYYIRQGYAAEQQNTVTYPTSLISTIQELGDTLIDFRIHPIKVDEDIAGNKLVFMLPRCEFLKHVELYGGYDGFQWQWVKRDYLYRVKELEKNEIVLDNVKKFSYYRLRILDNAENITLMPSQLVRNVSNIQWQRYLQSTELPFELKTNNNTTVVTLQNSQHLRIKQINLDVEENFQRKFEVSADSQLIAVKPAELYKLKFQNVDIVNTTINFGDRAAMASPIQLKIYNRDDRPLTIHKVVVAYFVDKLVFTDTGSPPYRLLWGNDKAVKPVYELALQAKYIEDEPQDVGTFGLAETASKKGLPIPQVQLFNFVVAVISIGLVLLLARKLQDKQ